MILQIDVFQLDPDITSLSCSGRFTLGTRLSEAEAMMNSLIQKGVRKLVLDLTHVDFLDSAGLGIIMHIFGEMQEAGGRFRVAGAAEQARRLFELTHTTTILAIDPDVETSVRALQDKGASADER